MKKFISAFIAVLILAALGAGCTAAPEDVGDPITTKTPDDPSSVETLPPVDAGNLLPYDPLRDDRGEKVNFEIVEDDGSGKITYAYMDYHYCISNVDGSFTISKSFEGFGKIDILLQGEGFCTAYDIKGTTLVYSVDEKFYTMTTDGERITEVCTIAGYKGEPNLDWYARHIAVTVDCLYYLEPTTAKLYKYSLSGEDIRSEVVPLMLNGEGSEDTLMMLALVDSEYAYAVSCTKNGENAVEEYTPVNVSRFILGSGKCDLVVEGRIVNVRSGNIYMLMPSYTDGKTLEDRQTVGFAFVMLNKGEQKTLCEYSFMQAVDYVVTKSTSSAVTVSAGTIPSGSNHEKAHIETVRLNYEGMTIK